MSLNKSLKKCPRWAMEDQYGEPKRLQIPCRMSCLAHGILSKWAKSCFLVLDLFLSRD
jgi:hypothetical protein